MDTKRGKSKENMKIPRIGADKEPKKPRASPIRKSVKAGLWLPVSRVHRDMKRECAKRIQIKASIYLTAALEYLCAEILEMSGKAAKDFNRKRITARHLQLVIRSDEELNRLLATVSIPHEPVLRRKGKSKKTKSQPQPKKSNQLTINGD